MIPLKLTQIGNSTGVLLPKEALEKMHVSKGDVIYLTESPDGFRVTPYDPQFESQMEAAADIMKRYRNTLKILAQ